MIATLVEVLEALVFLEMNLEMQVTAFSPKHLHVEERKCRTGVQLNDVGGKFSVLSPPQNSSEADEMLTRRGSCDAIDSSLKVSHPIVDDLEADISRKYHDAVVSVDLKHLRITEQ